MNTKGYYVREGSYQRTYDDRLGRWYIGLHGHPFYPWGEGYATPAAAWAGVKRLISYDFPSRLHPSQK